MNDALKTLFDQLKDSSVGSKAVAGLVGLALVLALGVTAVVTNRPHLEVAFQGLNDQEVSRVTLALSEAGIAFDATQPPAPYTVFVDRNKTNEAKAAAYGAEALTKPLRGIRPDAGMGSVFQGSEERLQAVRKREWQEMESIIETIEAVHSASLRTSPESRNPLMRARQKPVTAAVTLRMAGTHRLTNELAYTVARMVSAGLGIEMAGLVVTDQAGHAAFSGSTDKGEETPLELFSIKQDFDREKAELANRILEETLGPNKARVTVESVWNFDQSTITVDASSGKGSKISETKNTTETPLGAPLAVGGTPGASANVVDGSEAAGLDLGNVSPKQASVEPLVSKTNEEKIEYRPSTTRTQTVRTVPTVQRLSIAAFFDESLPAEQLEGLSEAIKAAVGFDAERSDDFKAVSVPFFQPEVLEETEESAGELAPVSEPDPLMETLLERAVEIVSAVVFLLVLLKSLKSSKGTTGTSQSRADDASGNTSELDPELLARVQIEELLSSDPDKVGEILSSWARDEVKAGAGS